MEIDEMNGRGTHLFRSKISRAWSEIRLGAAESVWAIFGWWHRDLRHSLPKQRIERGGYKIGKAWGACWKIGE